MKLILGDFVEIVLLWRSWMALLQHLVVLWWPNCRSTPRCLRRFCRTGSVKRMPCGSPVQLPSVSPSRCWRCSSGLRRRCRLLVPIRPRRRFRRTPKRTRPLSERSRNHGDASGVDSLGGDRRAKRTHFGELIGVENGPTVAVSGSFELLWFEASGAKDAKGGRLRTDQARSS